MAKNKEEKEETALVETPKVTSVVQYDYGDHAGKGFEGQTAADFVIPMIKILQGLSPEVSAGKGRPGQFFHTVTEDTWDPEEGISLVPVFTQHVFGKWLKREEGGGFRGNETIDSKVVLEAKAKSTEFGKYFTQDKDGKTLALRECFYLSGIQFDAESGEPITPVVTPFAGTKIKPWRTFNSRLMYANLKDATGKKLPLFSMTIRITSKLETKNNNQFWVPIFSAFDKRGLQASVIAPDDVRFQMAAELHRSYIEGATRIEYEKEGADAAKEAETPF